MELIFDKTKKIFLIIFTLFLNLLMISPALASSTNYVPLVNVPGVNSDAGVLTYLSGLYNFLISVVGILAMAVIIYGGLRYLTSAGNPGATGEAKDAITSAIIGLLLALASWVILSTINPDILVLKPIGVGLSGNNYATIKANNSCITSPNGDGTSAYPCDCVDGTKVYSLKKTANLTLAVDTSYNASGKLTDQNGVGLGGQSITITWTNTAVSASTTSLSITTKADGTFTYNPIRTACSGTEQWQAYFAGDATYNEVYSNVATITVTSGPACTAANYGGAMIAPKMGGGGACQQICSNKNLANDGAYHCLKAVMVALVTKDLPYEVWGQNSRSYDTPENPLTIPDNTWIAWNGLNYSMVYPNYPGLTQPIQYCFDGLPSPSTSNGVCDLASEGGSGNARATGNILYSDFLGKSNCTTITNPASIQCKFNYIIQDSSVAPVSSSTNLYVRILKP